MELEINITYIKILETVDNLNQMNAFPMVEGVKKILRGEEDFETLEYKDTSTFATLISLGNRTLCSDVKMLIRYGYLRNIYDEKSDKYYLSITLKGKETLEEYKSKHKVSYKKSKRKEKPTILKK